MIRRFLEGDEQAFTELVRQWETKVFNFAWRYLGNREDAQDVVQETFLSVFKSAKSLRDPDSFPTWLYRITLNHCRSRWRRRSSDVALDEPLQGGANGERDLTLSMTAGYEPRDSVETRDLIRKALMGLSEEHRSAIILKEYVGLNLEEVARVMDCPLSTAKSRLYHGLRGVQRNLARIGIRS
ncbi:MAG: sigma-70 family RNA polymerase sigma factor [Acidobacteriia bacterium]|nr:sigma-70 family RNA polymerase sigma factor [Terriglobia bacterium]